MFFRRFSIDAQPEAVQQILPKGANLRFEGLAFSPEGDVLGAATADTNAVVLFRRNATGQFDDEPYATLDHLNYPHDLSFGRSGHKVLLAVAERSGAISVFEDRGRGKFASEPSHVVTGPQARLSHTDGVAFVPPHNDCLAACNLLTGAISFYQQTSDAPVRFSSSPDLELTHASLIHPDGLAFSSNGRWLAVANHASHSVSVFGRQHGAVKGKTPIYGPEPAAVITGPDLCHTHSVAFTDGHLVATNAGANHFTVYRTSRSLFRRSIEPERVHQQPVADEDVFRGVNTQNKMEGGPKGIAVHHRTLAVCSPEIGIKLYPIRG
jgi:6-phosphogluconolactonase (cycloisomerase 2 family)